MSVLLPGRRLLAMSLSVSVIAGVIATTAAFGVPGVEAPEHRYAAVEQERAPLPAGSAERGRAGVERSALRLAAALDTVPVRADGDEATRYCPHDRLEVQWAVPGDEYAVGGYVTPVGPAPSDSTSEVNGIVVCTGATYAYMGFEARWNGTAWAVEAVPALSDEHDVHEEAHEEAHEEHGEREEHGDHKAAAPARPAPVRPAAPPAARRGFAVPAVAGIDPYAAYDPQRSCDPVAKPGMVALRDLLLGTYSGTRNLGVVRSCTARGVSEHKEGRAFDWGVNVGVASERAAAESVLSHLLATDAAGNRHALARRLGVMYVIWDRRIWSSYRPDAGWRPYSGANAHTDHVHLSLSWAGAMGRTSYWQGNNAELLRFDPELVLAAPAGGAGSQEGNRVARVSGDSERAPAPHRPKPRRTEEADEHAREPRAERRGSEHKGSEHTGNDRKGNERKDKERSRRGRDEQSEPSPTPAPTPVTVALAPAVAEVESVPVAAPRAARPPKPTRGPKPEREAKAERPPKAPKAPKAEDAPKPEQVKATARRAPEKAAGTARGKDAGKVKAVKAGKPAKAVKAAKAPKAAKPVKAKPVKASRAGKPATATTSKGKGGGKGKG